MKTLFAFATMFSMAIALGLLKIYDVLIEIIKDEIKRRRLDKTAD